MWYAILKRKVKGAQRLDIFRIESKEIEMAFCIVGLSPGWLTKMLLEYNLRRS
jgi:hypothetical protein